MNVLWAAGANVLHELPTRTSFMMCGREQVLHKRQIMVCCTSSQVLYKAGATRWTNSRRRHNARAAKTIAGTDAEQVVETAGAYSIRRCADRILSDGRSNVDMYLMSRSATGPILLCKNHKCQCVKTFSLAEAMKDKLLTCALLS